jgi:hypothetical protein
MRWTSVVMTDQERPVRDPSLVDAVLPLVMLVVLIIRDRVDF